jgi:hypothetical protein
MPSVRRNESLDKRVSFSAIFGSRRIWTAERLRATRSPHYARTRLGESELDAFTIIRIVNGHTFVSARRKHLRRWKAFWFVGHARYRASRRTRITSQSLNRLGLGR